MRQLLNSIALFGFVVANAFGQNTGTGVVVSASAARAVALASTANYRVIQDGKWKNYEDVLILGVLNELTKASANAGQSSTPPDYAAVARQLRAWLDSRMPNNPMFADEAAVFRYGIDALMPLLQSSSDTFLTAHLQRYRIRNSPNSEA